MSTIKTPRPMLYAKSRKVSAGEIGEGTKYTAHDWTATGRRRRRKPKLEELLQTREACRRAQSASNAIRAAAGLDPIPPNFFRENLDEAIRAKRTVKRSGGVAERSIAGRS